MSILTEPAKEPPKPFLKIKEFPDEMLQRRAMPWLEPVDNLQFQEWIAAMVRTMAAARALGIAGPQVGIPFRVFAIRLNNGATLVAINPVLATTGDPSDTIKVSEKEGCLSFPGIQVRVERYSGVEMDYTDINGNPQTIVLKGLEARAAQHEADHLDGVLFTDLIPKVMRSKALEDLRNFKKIYPRRVKSHDRQMKSLKAKIAKAKRK